MSRPGKRSFSINGHRTSISLEPEFWDAFKVAAQSQGKSVAQLVTEIDAARSDTTNLSSAVRVWLLAYFRKSSGGAERAAISSTAQKD